jgi:hypothetical protein
LNRGKSHRETNRVNSCGSSKQTAKFVELDDRVANLAITKRSTFDLLVEEPFLKSSGEGGIRTPGTVSRPRHFQCRTIGRSVTSPERCKTFAVRTSRKFFQPSNSVLIGCYTNRCTKWVRRSERLS